MASPLAPMIGIWLTALFCKPWSEGVESVQNALVQKDNWTVKGTVIAMVYELIVLASVIESVQMAAAFSNVYAWLIDGFGDFENLGIIHWWGDDSYSAGYGSIDRTVSVDVCGPGAFCKMHLSMWWASIGIGNIASSVKQACIVPVPKVSLHAQCTHQVTSNLQAAFALASDMLITFGLCWRLNKSRTGIQALNTRQQAMRMHGSTVVEQISMPVFASNAKSVQSNITVQSGTMNGSEARLENLAITDRKFEI
ncbi:hypothetical protein B0H10DRAFT_1971534 [Mycena sp. CBHHK59/15]|nr:hypothetical protein B0H10DRAFT_1971534 [Mycena sp. CBHHK59/15]